MSSFIISLLCLAVALAAVSVRKTYASIPHRELKRRAQNLDPLSSRMYPAAAYGATLRLVLWFLILVPAAAACALLSGIAPPFLSFIAVLLLIGLAFAWLPNRKISKLGYRLTSSSAPAMTWLLGYVHTPVHKVMPQLQNRLAKESHTGLYERADLLDLIAQQRSQADNRISASELEVAWRALSLEDHRVSESMISLDQVHAISASDTIGPILIDELHSSGLSSVLVYETDKHNIIGTLQVHELGLYSSGTVADHLKTGLAYLHEDDSFGDALEAFFATCQSLFVVLSPNQSAVGILTAEMIFQELTGQLPSTELDSYQDRRSVASRLHLISEPMVSGSADELEAGQDIAAA